MKWLIGLVLALPFIFIPATASAQSPENDDDFTLRINGDATISQGERVNSVVVISGDLTVEGEVTDFALVIDGDAIVSGKVGGDLTVISGDIDLASTAVVDNLNSVRGEINRASGATILGDVSERDSFRFLWWAASLFSILLWLGMTLAVIAAALIFAAFGGRQLSAASRGMTGDLVNTIIGGVFLWVAVPILAGIAIVTIVGLPFGLGLLLFLLPTLGFLGYLVAGTRLGMWLLGLGSREPGDRPFLAAGLGMLALQLLVLIPVLGVAIALLAGIWGGGALAFRLYRNAGGKGVEGAESPAPQSASGMA
ncbi:MAG TPA: hypothetical protein VFS30_06060 [Dehalococcoidia bacterium]|nr:hypothetical protein [Dehalococcoidia bacterium]